MQSPDTGATAKPQRSLLPLWLILGVCVAPIAASYIAFYFWQPSGQVNYGELLEPRLPPDVELKTQDGRAFRLSELKGEWVLVVADRGACDAACARKLTYIRQVRLAQRKDQGRIERLWLVMDGVAPAPALVTEHPGLIVAREGTKEIVDALPAAGSPLDHIYVIDPLGHVMMRFPADPDPRRILKDLSRLLRHSKWK